jgi:glutathione synthase/RimK-type ligase-like ATP-grasp enzyme
LPSPNSRVGFVTYAGVSDLTEDDRLAAALLTDSAIPVDPLVWDDPAIAWNSYAALILRSTWDYHKKSPAFQAWLDHVERQSCPLWNPVSLVRWNMDKSYLRGLGAAGIPITPTAWLDRRDRANLAAILQKHGWERAVVKPSLSATAFQTWTTTPGRAGEDQGRLETLLERGSVLVQKFEESIALGEWSLVFFAGELSHAVLKTPKEGDFRVQKDFGGTSAPGVAPRRVIECAERTLGLVREPWLYARVDLVDAADGVRLMELEMLEPDLFLRHHPEAPRRFAEAIISAARLPASPRR